MKRYDLVLTLSSGEVIEKTTVDPDKFLKSVALDYPSAKEYEMLCILGLTDLVKGYIVSIKAELRQNKDCQEPE